MTPEETTMLIDITTTGAAFADPTRITHILAIPDKEGNVVGSEVYLDGNWTTWANSDLAPAELARRIREGGTPPEPDGATAKPEQGTGAFIRLDGSALKENVDLDEINAVLNGASARLKRDRDAGA